jgi:hypothetical protein
MGTGARTEQLALGETPNIAARVQDTRVRRRVLAADEQDDQRHPADPVRAPLPAGLVRRVYRYKPLIGGRWQGVIPQDDILMGVLELAPGALQGKQGRVTYPPAFAVTDD